MTPVQVAVSTESVRPALRLVGFATGAFLTAGLVALVYRAYTRLRISGNLASLFGLAAVALYLNTVGVFGQLFVGETGVFAPTTVVFNVVVIVVSAAATVPGRYLGDRIATDVFAVAGAKALDAEVSRLVRSVGRITAVELPEAVEDIENYDPVDAETKEKLSGKTLLFPHRQTVTQLRNRLVTRLKDDYDIGHVDIELDEDGTVTYLAVGSRATGLGPTLAPGAVAVAVHADPASNASPGDVVQVWRTDPVVERVVTGELRAVEGDVATLVVDEVDATRLGEGTYRLVTLPAEPQAAREFASLLRTADETMGVVSVTEGSRLAGETVATLDTTVVAIRPAGEPIETLPSRSRALSPGDEVFVVARPEVLRQLEADGTDPASAT